MSRFGNLEFNEESHQAAERPLVKDGAFYLDQAQRFLQRGKFEQALRSYAKVLEFDPKSADAWLGQIRMLVELSEFSEAKLWADRALEIYPDNGELLAAKAVALARSGDLEGAISLSDASVETSGNTPYIWLARGDVLLARKERRAEYCFDKALALGGANWIWRWLIARAQSFYNRFARALALIKEAVAISPEQAVLWLEMGRCQLALGMAGQARQSFEQARELDPECESVAGLLSEARNITFIDRLRASARKLFRQ